MRRLFQLIRLNPFLHSTLVLVNILKRLILVKFRSLLDSTLFELLCTNDKCLYSSYLDRYQKISVAAVPSEALVLPPCIFYDSTNRHGFLERGLENARRKLPGSQKKFVWSRKKGINSTRCDTTQLADPELAELSQPAGHSVELQNPKRCPRGFMSCTLCLELSNLDEIEKLYSLRVEEIKASTKLTFCFRQNWVHSSDQPSLSRLMLKFPKFRIIPELVFCCQLLCDSFYQISIFRV
ncbi:uncharacterized protein LOC136087362 isoform X2 [Hydra vulgaris]|uniref:Uncharacterized protein LOC136087362 isoform X2 n=1 Tax=Hydra vulgaris TaxID=6087 RepID=A0ABM4CVM2_HYDVU